MEAISPLIGLFAIISGIAIIFFHVPPEQAASVSINVSKVLFVICAAASLIVSIKDAIHSKKDRYGLKKPLSSDEKLDGIVWIIGGVMAGYGVVFAIISMIFGKSPFSQAIGFVFTFLLLGVIYSVIFLILLKVLYSIIDNIYYSRLRKVQLKEKNAHEIYDPIMIEAVDKITLADSRQIEEYCKDNAHLNENQEFLEYSFFFSEALYDHVKAGKLLNISTQYAIPEQYAEAHSIWDPAMLEIVDDKGRVDETIVKNDIKEKKLTGKYDKFLSITVFFVEGLTSLVKENKIKAIEAHMSKGVKTLYETLNPAKRAEVTEEISLDDDDDALQPDYTTPAVSSTGSEEISLDDYNDAPQPDYITPAVNSTSSESSLDDDSLSPPPQQTDTPAAVSISSSSIAPENTAVDEEPLPPRQSYTAAAIINNSSQTVIPSKKISLVKQKPASSISGGNNADTAAGSAAAPSAEELAEKARQAQLEKNEEQYKKALECMSREQYSNAIEIFSSIREYRDSSRLLEKAKKEFQRIEELENRKRDFKNRIKAVKERFDPNAHGEKAEALVKYTDQKELLEKIKVQGKSARYKAAWLLPLGIAEIIIGIILIAVLSGADDKDAAFESFRSGLIAVSMIFGMTAWITNGIAKRAKGFVYYGVLLFLVGPCIAVGIMLANLLLFLIGIAGGVISLLGGIAMAVIGGISVSRISSSGVRSEQTQREIEKLGKEKEKLFEDEMNSLVKEFSDLPYKVRQEILQNN